VNSTQQCCVLTHAPSDNSGSLGSSGIEVGLSRTYTEMISGNGELLPSTVYTHPVNESRLL
jgi:hypothetical protein